MLPLVECHNICQLVMHLKLKGPSGVDSVLSGSCPSFLKPPALLAVGVGPRHMQLDPDALSVLRDVQHIRGRAMYMAYARPCQAWSSGGKLRMSEATQDVKDITTACTGQVHNAVEQIQKKRPGSIIN